MIQNSLHEWLRTIGILLIGIAVVICTLRYSGHIKPTVDKQNVEFIGRTPFAPPG